MKRFFLVLTIILSISVDSYSEVTDNNKVENDSTMTFDELWKERDSLIFIIEAENGSRKVLEQFKRLRIVDDMIITELLTHNRDLSISDSILCNYEFLLSDSTWVFEKDKFLILQDDDVPQIFKRKYDLYTQIYQINQKLIGLKGKIEKLKVDNPDLAEYADLTKSLLEKYCGEDLDEIMNLLIVLKDSDLTPLSLIQKEFITYLDGEFYKLASLVE